MSKDMSRRDFFRAGALTVLATAGAAAIANKVDPAAAAPPIHPGHEIGTPTVVGEVDHRRNGFNPTETLTGFDRGELLELVNGQTLRQYEIRAVDKTIEVVPGIEFEAWTYNGRIPGPTLRCKEGELVRINFINEGSHPHSIHFHGIHTAEMDGVEGAGPGLVGPGESATYEFEAQPAGLHPYYSHTFPLTPALSRGLFGAFIVEPEAGWPQVDHELVMVLNGVDLYRKNSNNFYAVNGIPFHFQKHPINIRVNETVRLFMVNMLNLEPVNTFHLHSAFFQYYPSGTSLTAAQYTDTLTLGLAQRGILEFSYQFPGFYIFRAQMPRAAELGYLGVFQVSI
jgi:FtsP/CotA-like multicopper oxidase with cupredoxin domain